MKSIIILLSIGCLSAYFSTRVSNPELHELLIIATVGCLAGAFVRSMIYCSKPRDRK